MRARADEMGCWLAACLRCVCGAQRGEGDDDASERSRWAVAKGRKEEGEEAVSEVEPTGQAGVGLSCRRRARCGPSR